MSLDDELEKAVNASEAADAEESAQPVVANAPPRSSRKRINNLGLLVALLVMSLGILAVVLTSFKDSAIYSKGVDEMLAEKEKLDGRKVRVMGTLVKGSLKKRDAPCEYRFKLEKNNAQVDVRYPQCIVPDTFRDMPGMDVEVTAEGSLAEGGHFEASHIMAKCPSKYEMKEMQSKGQKAPHAAVQPASAEKY